MNLDSIMSDQPSTSSGSFPSEDPSQRPNLKPASWNTPKFREEYENSKNRLQHQDFSSCALPDPVTMRPTQSRLPGEDPATIQRMQAIVATAKLKAQAEGGAPWP